MNALADLIVYATTIVIYLFGIGYGFFAPWWRSAMGRNVMAMTVTHAMVFTLITVALLFGVNWTGRPFVRVLIYGSIMFVFAWRGMILIREQILARDETPVAPVFRRKDTLMWGKYGKAIAQVLMAVLVVGVTVTSGDGNISDEEKFQLATAFVSAIGVYLVPAVPEWPWMKTALAALLVALQTAGSLALDGLSTNDILVIAAAAFGLVVTAIAPANSEQRHRSTQHPTLMLALIAGLAIGLGGVTIDASPARADDWSEMAEDCEYSAPYLGSAGYQVTQNGTAYAVWVTSGWQYVGNWESFCEDINIAPYQALWNSGIVKARTYMCNSAGSCWYNAWRNCQGGCVAASDMADGTKYQVHVYMNQHPGWWAQLWD